MSLGHLCRIVWWFGVSPNRAVLETIVEMLSIKPLWKFYISLTRFFSMHSSFPMTSQQEPRHYMES